MMREWQSERVANLSDALLADLSKLRRCCDSLAPRELDSALELDEAKGFEATDTRGGVACGKRTRT